jgi:hypothetical protein
MPNNQAHAVARPPTSPPPTSPLIVPPHDEMPLFKLMKNKIYAKRVDRPIIDAIN